MCDSCSLCVLARSTRGWRICAPLPACGGARRQPQSCASCGFGVTLRAKGGPTSRSSGRGYRREGTGRLDSQAFGFTISLDSRCCAAELNRWVAAKHTLNHHNDTGSGNLLISI